ncbi:PhoX family protein [Catellatospora coxensis]|uniref:Uncharacterized protein n=1 Tax=Catellatospora coxensis TaxID=310354 RepID=A0A8J3KJH5_9ACTN|nr:alkaline phosphatase PhoX [Catellatospora coxensis]GIG03773.1 hypothetical protein Cco03nite_04730 [Catellatospora coxensis]
MTRPFTTDRRPSLPATAWPLVGPTDHDGTAVIVGWGDAVLPATPSSGLTELDPLLQEGQCGFDSAVLAVLPLRGRGRALLVLGHASAGLAAASAAVGGLSSTQRARLLQAAQGVSVIEVEQAGPDRRWRMRHPRNHGYNRRLGTTTAIACTGPVPELAASPGVGPAGVWAPAGGTATAWGTVLLAESPACNVHRGVGPPPGRSCCGWVVEIDPFDPHSVPRRHTALGRARYAGVLAATTAAGRPVVHLRERGGLLLRFTSCRRASRGIGATDRARNAGLLHDGTLAVARLDRPPTSRANGGGTWLPLVSVGVSAVAGMSAAQVLADTSGAARAVGATTITEAVQLPIVGLRRSPGGAEHEEQVIELDDTGASSFTWRVRHAVDPLTPVLSNRRPAGLFHAASGTAFLSSVPPAATSMTTRVGVRAVPL